MEFTLERCFLVSLDQAMVLTHPERLLGPAELMLFHAKKER